MITMEEQQSFIVTADNGLPAVYLCNIFLLLCILKLLIYTEINLNQTKQILQTSPYELS